MPNQYTIIIEKGKNSFGAYVPDFPGCFAVGKTRQETIQLLKETIHQHLKCLTIEGFPIPEPNFSSEHIEI